MPSNYVVLDLSGATAPQNASAWSVGRYDEVRPQMYKNHGNRCLHVGIDLGAPVGTAVCAFADGKVLHVGCNPNPGDYGFVIVTEHVVDGQSLYALFGHLSATSVVGKTCGAVVKRGDTLGWIGSKSENGGWPPHVHFQLSRVRPPTHDMPGVVDPAERDVALKLYPDPRVVLGKIY